MTTPNDRTAHRAVIAAVLFGALWLPWAPARVLATFFVAGVVPGLGLMSRSRLWFEGAIGAGTSLSPVVFAVLVLAGLFAGLDMRVAALGASAVGLLLFVVLGNGLIRSEHADRRALAGVGMLAIVAAVLAFTLPLSEMWWRVRDDSWFHAAVADKLTRDSLPLFDPYFAGLRIQYMYAYHALIAGCSSLAGIDFFHAMILINAMALLSAVLAFHALAGEFSRRAGPRVLGVALLVFGMNGWFFLSYPIRFARALFGQTQGLETLRTMIPWTPPGHATAITLLSVEGNQFMFLDKFMLGTAISLTFGLMAAVLLLLVHARRGYWSVRYDIAFVLSMAGAILFHSVIGITAAVATAVVLALLLIVRSQPSPGGPSYARLLAWVLLAIALVVPYIASLLPRDGGSASISFALQPSQFMGLLFDVLPALVLTGVFLRFASRDTDDALGSRPFAELSLSATGIILAWTLMVALIAVTVDLVTNNETKFAFLLIIPLCALAVGGLDRMWRSRRGRVVALVVVLSATVPLNVVYFSQAFRDASMFETSDTERAVYSWLKKQSPDVVVIEADDNVRVPVLASRDTYWGTETYARNWGYPAEEMAARRKVRDAIFSAQGPSTADFIRLRALGRPVFVVYRSHPDDLIDAHERFERHARFHGRFATPKIAVWELQLDE